MNKPTEHEINDLKYRDTVSTALNGKGGAQRHSRRVLESIFGEGDNINGLDDGEGPAR